ncbi:hypothetical protein GCM10029964_056320 [Kibdelosporangium lantanae]
MGWTSVPRPSKREVAEAVLLIACSLAGLDARDAWLVRWVGNAVFRLRRHPAMVKVMTSLSLIEQARAAMVAANHFADHGVPVVEPWPARRSRSW